MKEIKNYKKSYMVDIKDFFKKSGIVIITSIISSTIVTTSIMIYSIDANGNDYNIDTQPISSLQEEIEPYDIVHKESNNSIISQENINKNSSILSSETLEKLDLIGEKLENDPLFRLQSDFEKEDFQNYMFGLLDSDTKNRIDKLIEEEIALTNYDIDNVPDDVVHDSVKSTILFYLSGGDLQAFDYIDSFRDKINHSVAALVGLFKLETGSDYINYSTTVRSHTLAFGRGQINGSTLGEISVRLVDAGFPLNKIKHPYANKKYKYPYHKIKALVKKLSKNRNWSARYKDKTINDLIRISKRFNYRVKTYLRETYGKNIPDRFKFLVNDYDKFSNIKLYDWSIAMLELYKDPVFQGYMSLHVLQEKMRMASRIYKGRIYSSNELLYYAFELYNGSQKIVKDPKLGRVKYCKVYADKVNNYFKKYINHIRDNQLYTFNNTQTLDSEIDI